jgi:PAS domain S-box-containing protein
MRTATDAARLLPARLLGSGRLVAIAVAYFLAAKGSLVFASINPSATPIWPPTGLALGIVLLLGYRTLPAIFAGALAANITTAGGLIASIAIAAGNTCEALVGAFLIMTWAGGTDAFRTPTGIAKASGAIAVSTTISATAGLSALILSGAADPGGAAAIWMTWWLGDLAGAAMVAPVVVLWARDPRLASSIGPGETLALVACAVLAGGFALGPLVPAVAGRNGLAFIAIAPLMWAALRGGPRNTATVALILSAFAVWGVAAGTGPFVEATLNSSFLLVVSFVVSITLPSLALSAAVTSRDQALAQYDLAVQAGEVGIWDWNLLTNEIEYSERAKSIFGFPARRPVTFEQVRDATHPDDLPNTSAMGRRARDPQLRETLPYQYRIVRPDGAVHWVLANGRAIFEGNRAVRYLGTIQDVTGEKVLSQSLEESNAKLRLAMSAGRLAVWEFKAADGIVVGSPELNELLGFPRDQPVTTAEFRSRYAAGEYERLKNLVRAALKRGENLLEAEVRFSLPGNQPLWLLVRAEFLGTGRGKIPDCLGVAVDITARKQSEDHLVLLMGELNHRVKNALAIVQGIAAQTYRTSPDPQEAHARFQGRLRALARAHDILTEREWRDADLGGLVAATVTPHAGEMGERLRMTGPPVTLTPRQALDLSMVLHELATNALKYGSLSTESGRLEVSWNAEVSEGARRLHFMWKESGGPKVISREQEGFGLKMIERSLRALSGASEIQFDPAGVQVSLHLLLSEAYLN